jgi:hypothetical protein
MKQLQPILVTAAIALVVMAILFRAPLNIRKLVLGS